MHVLYIKPYKNEDGLLKELVPEGVRINFAEGVAALDEADRLSVDTVSVFVDYQLTADVMQRLPNLRFIATRSAGYDHIDMEYVAAHNIVVSRVPQYGTRTVAEFTIALLFALARNAFRAYTDMLQRSALSNIEVYEGFDLAGKTLGVVGTGAIGRSVCQIARGIGMNVIAYDVRPDETFAEHTGVRYAPLETVLAECHVLTLHVPSLPQTHHLINAERLALMQPGSYLINTARGNIVDTKALVAALEEGRLAGAGLDVLEGEHELHEEASLLAARTTDTALWETLAADHALIDMPNVIVTPHIAFNTIEAKREITQITAENICAFNANSPINVIAV